VVVPDVDTLLNKLKNEAKVLWLIGKKIKQTITNILDVFYPNILALCLFFFITK
jgi:hypothetical protein